MTCGNAGYVSVEEVGGLFVLSMLDPIVYSSRSALKNGVDETAGESILVDRPLGV